MNEPTAPAPFNGSVWGTKRRFRQNVRRILCLKGITFTRFASIVGEMNEHEYLSKIWADAQPQAIERKVRRLLQGAARVKLDHVELLAEILGIPPAVLAYGSVQEVHRALGLLEPPAFDFR